MTVEAFGAGLATVNALLNLSSAVLLVAGLRFVRRRDLARHRKCMVGAVTAAALFLVFYVVRFSLTGTHRFEGPAPLRAVYLSILFSHMALAVAIVPMVARLLLLVRRRRFKAHAKLARWTFPLWLYVSVTGLIVYVMLYHVGGQ